MKPLQTDLSIYKKFGFERIPVAVNYSLDKPEGIDKLDKYLGLCEMIKEAQQRGNPFYFTGQEENCVGKAFLGLAEETPFASDDGILGVKLELYQSGWANIRLRSFVPKLKPGMVNYVVMSPLDKLEFEPDLLIFVVPVSQGEILLRATTYSTGDMYESHGTAVGNCANVFVYPYLTGKVNFTITGISYGMKGRKVFPEGLMLISIPYQWIPAVTQNLNEMKWVPKGFSFDDRDAFFEYESVIRKEIAESKNP